MDTDESGFHVFTGHDPLGEEQWELQDSDIIYFRNTPADSSGYQALLLQVGDPTLPDDADFMLPSFAHVTLEAVQQPGEWQVRGIFVRRRLFTVSVRFGC